MAKFTKNVERIDPYKNFRFQVFFEGRQEAVAGISKITGTVAAGGDGELPWQAQRFLGTRNRGTAPARCEAELCGAGK